MDNVESVLSLCMTIYQMVENTKANKERCQRVAQRVRALEGLVQTIKQRGPGQMSATVNKALMELCITLISAKNLMMKYSQTKAFKSFLKSKIHEEEFSKVNERLTDNFQVLSGALQIEHGNMLYEVYRSVSVEDEVQPLTSPTAMGPPPMPTAPMPLPQPMSNSTAMAPPPMPTAPMLLPQPMSNPTAMAPPPMPTAPMLLPQPMSNPTAMAPPPMPTAPMPLHMPAYRPIAPIPVQCIVPPQPWRVPAAAMPVHCITPPMQVSSPTNTMLLSGAMAPMPLSTNMVHQCVPAPMSSVIVSHTTAPMAPMPYTRPVAPMTYLPQHTNSLTTYIKSFLR